MVSLWNVVADHTKKKMTRKVTDVKEVNDGKEYVCFTQNCNYITFILANSKLACFLQRCLPVVTHKDCHSVRFFVIIDDIDHTFNML